jgi:hypothetical protein
MVDNLGLGRHSAACGSGVLLMPEGWPLVIRFGNPRCVSAIRFAPINLIFRVNRAWIARLAVV